MKFLIIGGGSIGKRHIRNLQFLGHHEIYCLKRSKDTLFEEEFGLKTIESPGELDGIQIDAVVVCTPTSRHVEGIKIAKDLGSAVFVEKPLIHSAAELMEAKWVWDKSTSVFFVGFMLRYHPLVKKIKEIMVSDVLGKVYSARFEFGSFLPYWHPWEDYKLSYASIRELGGGVINTISHELDLIQYFFGVPRAIFCESGNFGKLQIEVEEIAEAIFRYPDKLVTLHLDYLQKQYDRNIKILCEEGKISWNWHDNKVVVEKFKAERVEYNIGEGFDVNSLYIDEMKDFISLVQNKRLEHPLDFGHAVENANLIQSLHQSSALGVKIII